MAYTLPFADHGAAMRAKLPVLSACLTFACLLGACGQTGPLYLPDEGVTTPVEIRPAPASSAAADEEQKEEEEADASEDGQPRPAGD